jgi:Ca2+-binding RTX toxin-like protein
MTRRLGGVLAAATCVCALAPTVSSVEAATTVTARVDSRGGGFYIYVQGDAATNDTVVKFNRRNTVFVIADQQPLETSDCDHLMANEVRCEGPRDASIGVYGGAGDDRARIARSVRTPTTLVGESGDDTILGGPRSDHIFGRTGDDVLRGRRGRDRFEGSGANDGEDAFFGGRSSDLLFTNDHMADMRIGCGRGRRDRALIDATLDPRPIGCERVKSR